MTQEEQNSGAKTNIVIYLLLGLICLTPNLFYAFTGSTFADSLTKKAAYLFLSLIVFLIPFLFLKRKTAFTFSLLYVILSPLEIIHLMMYKDGVNSGFMLLLRQTNLSEALELTSSFAVYAIVWIFIIVVYIILLTKIRSNTPLFNSLQKRYFLIISSGTFIGLYLYTLSLGLINLTFKEAYRFSKEAYPQKFAKLYPLDIFIATKNAIKTRNEINRLSQNIANFRFNAKSGNPITDKEVYVLVIGETARYANFGINGYHRNTSPHLAKTSSLHSFHDVFTEANFTEGALPIMLTRATADNFEISRKEKSILEAFKECGFKTYWLSNQSFGNPFIGRITSESTGKYSTVKDYDSANNYDTYLLPNLDKVLSFNDRKQFIVIHSLGSHFRYNFRYPEEFRIFRPDFEGAFDYTAIKSSNKDKLINTYDNTMLFTDHFLSQIIEKLQKKSCISYMYYISDHGENLFDIGESVLHGGRIPTKYDAHIPLFIWTSKEFNSIFPEKILAIQNNLHKSITSSVSFHSLLDLANISVADMNFQKSIASLSLKSDSNRVMLNSNMETIVIR